MEKEPTLAEIQKQWHGTLKSYIIGFVISIILTFIAFFLVYERLFSGYALIYTIVGLGIAQAIAQLIFFLHVGQEAKPRWETFIFLIMVLLLLIIAIGSMWIMFDLDKRVMTEMPSGSSKEMHHD